MRHYVTLSNNQQLVIAEDPRTSALEIILAQPGCEQYICDISFDGVRVYPELSRDELRKLTEGLHGRFVDVEVCLSDLREDDAPTMALLAQYVPEGTISFREGRAYITLSVGAA